MAHRFPSLAVSSPTVFYVVRCCWEIDNQGFNHAKNRYGLEHLCHHQANSLLVVWLLICLALTVDRLHRVRYLHRGTHPVCAAIDLLRLLQLSLGKPAPAVTDSS